MPIYIAMLRGINVGGHKLIKMDRLRASLEVLGFQQVKTYIQSGNVVFKTGKTSTAGLSKRIEERILQDFGFWVSVVWRTADEMNKMIASNPFLKERGINPEKLHVMFLSESPAPAALKKLAELTAAPERCHGSGREIYFYLPNGVSQSVLWKNPVDRILAVSHHHGKYKTLNNNHHICRE